MTIDRNHLKRYESEAVEVTYKDGSRRVCYVDWVDTTFLTYRTEEPGRNAGEHFSGFSVPLPEIRFDEIEGVQRLVTESKLYKQRTPREVMQGLSRSPWKAS